MSLEDLKTIVKETPLSRVVGQYLPLKKNGHYYTGLCPFHSDSNPSLIVNDQRKMFMCFACDTGGDVITFVQKFKNIDFLDSLREISKILGLDFDSFNVGRLYFFKYVWGIHSSGQFKLRDFSTHLLIKACSIPFATE